MNNIKFLLTDLSWTMKIYRRREFIDRGCPISCRQIFNKLHASCLVVNPTPMMEQFQDILRQCCGKGMWCLGVGKLDNTNNPGIDAFHKLEIVIFLHLHAVKRTWEFVLIKRRFIFPDIWIDKSLIPKETHGAEITLYARSNVFYALDLNYYSQTILVNFWLTYEWWSQVLE